jgi:hypothetical protein
MIRFRSLTLLVGPLFAAGLFAQAPKLVVPQPSPASILKQRVGVTDIEIAYARPGAKGRVMIGKIEPYGKVWRTGANNATTVTFSTAVKLGGKDVPPANTRSSRSRTSRSGRSSSTRAPPNGVRSATTIRPTWFASPSSR